MAVAEQEKQFIIMNNFQKCLLFASLISVMVLVSCSHKYLPIVKTTKYYPPTANAMIVDSVPADAIYIGTIKVVPRDYSFETRSDRRTAVNNMREAAAKAGANYLYLVNMVRQNDDYYFRFFNAVTESFGEGYTIEAEMYR